LFLRKLLKDCYAYHTSGNINAEKRQTVNQKRARRKKKEAQGKAKQDPDLLNPRKNLANLFFCFALDVGFFGELKEGGPVEYCWFSQLVRRKMF